MSRKNREMNVVARSMKLAAESLDLQPIQTTSASTAMIAPETGTKAAAQDDFREFLFHISKQLRERLMLKGSHSPETYVSEYTR